MSATMTTVNGILKEVYEGRVRNQLQNETTALKRVTRSSEGVFETPGGKYVVFPVRKSRNAGISYRGENQALPGAGRQGYQQAQETLRYGYGQVRLTGQVMELAKTNAQAFVNAADNEMDLMQEDLLKDQNRIVWGHSVGFAATSGTGTITTVTSGATSATQTVASTNQLEQGMIVDVVDNAGAPVAGGTGLTINSIASATSVVLSGSITTVTNASHIVRTGNWNKEPYGLGVLVDDSGTVHNINSATAGNEYWRSIDDSSTTTLTEVAMVARCDDIRRKGGKFPSVVFCSLGVRRAYYNLMTSLRRYNEPKEFTGGLVGLAFNYEKELPVVTDVDCPDKSMYFLTESEITVYRTRDWYWDDTDGNIMKWVSGYDAYEGFMKSYWQLVTHQRNAHARMTNITEA